MKKFQKMHKPKAYKLQTKLFVAYLTSACIILFSFAIFFYIFVSDQLINSQLESMSNLNTAFQTQVDDALRDLDSVSVNINYSNISKSILDENFDLSISDKMLKNMSDLFITVSGTELKADQVNLFDFSGNVLQVGMSTMVRKSTFANQEYIEDALALNGSKLITLPYETDMYSKPVKYKQWFISIYRTFMNQHGKTVGSIETVKRCKSVFKSIISYKKKHKDIATDIYIFDKNGEVVYPYDTNPNDLEAIKQYYLISVSGTATSTINSPFGRGKEYIAKALSLYSGYTYLTVQPENVILQPVHNLSKILILVVALFLMVSTYICYRLSRSIVKPIKHLKHIIQRMELDTLGVERATSYPVSVNELEELYQAFQTMSDSLNLSMNQLMESQEQELKSRTLALQSQINPHFYYNSLSSIMVLAENGNSDEVSKMCRSLSNIMRYITDSSHITVQLRDEIDYVKKYLYCMKVRYQSSLNYTIDVPETLMDIQVPKLIIQPLVENAIKYGSDCEPPWHITIRGIHTPEYWKIEVLDSGNGFTPEALEKIATNIRKADENPGMPELKINGLGTLNVYLRWKLFCGKNMIFSYGNTPEGHGIVTVGCYSSQQTNESFI